MENQEEADTPDLAETLDRTDLVDPQLETDRPDVTEQFESECRRRPTSYPETDLGRVRVGL